MHDHDKIMIDKMAMSYRGDSKFSSVPPSWRGSESESNQKWNLRNESGSGSADEKRILMDDVKRNDL